MIGWRELVGLPELGLPVLHAKIDTGARTTALHAHKIRVVDEDGLHLVEFLPPRIGKGKIAKCRFPIHDEREIRNTSGIAECRIIIRTTLLIGRRHWKIDLSLADRAGMTYPIIIGRTAIRRHNLLVDSGRSYLVGAPVPKTPKKKSSREEPK